MASNINANNIDGTYPVAGVDNDSQGFRTNFTNIKNNLTYAKSELEDLQSKVVLKSALTGTTLNNSMGGAALSGAEISDFRETVVDLGTASGSQTLDHAAAHVYTITTSDSISVTFTNFPSGRLGRIKLKVVLQSTAHTLTLPTAVNRGIDGLEGYNASTRAITFAAAGTYYFEFLTNDQGSTIHITDLSRPRYATSTNTDWSSSVSSFDRYEYSLLTTNFDAAVNNRLYIDSGTTLARGNVYLPASPSDGQTVVISTNNAVTTFRVSSNAGTLILGNVTTLAANSTVKYQFVTSSTPNKWFKTT